MNFLASMHACSSIIKINCHKLYSSCTSLVMSVLHSTVQICISPVMSACTSLHRSDLYFSPIQLNKDRSSLQ